MAATRHLAQHMRFFLSALLLVLGSWSATPAADGRGFELRDDDVEIGSLPTWENAAQGTHHAVLGSAPQQPLFRADMRSAAAPVASVRHRHRAARYQPSQHRRLHRHQHRGTDEEPPGK